MEKKLSPRAAFIEAAVKGDIRRLAAFTWDTGMQAMTHDPDHEDRLASLDRAIVSAMKLSDVRFSDTCSRLSILERQSVKAGAPQYRTVRKGKVR